MIIANCARALAAIFVGAALQAAPASAQDFKAEWAKLVAAAELEASLIVFAQPNSAARGYVQAAWSKSFPKIALQLIVMPNPQFIARIRTERGAGKYLWDVAFTGYTAGYVLYKEDAIDPLMPELIDPDVKKPELWGGWDEAFVDNQKKYVFSMSAFIKGAFYNALHIPPERIAREGFKVMLDPALKGKLVWHDPAIPGSGQTFPYMLKTRLGDEGLRKIVLDQQIVWVAQQHMVVEALVRGTAWIGMGPAVTGLLGQYKDAGVKLDIRGFGNSPEVNDMSIGGSSMFVFNKRPHPAAARVFVNWILTRENQHGLAKAQDQNSRRRDVPSIAGPDETARSGAKYVEVQREQYQAELLGAVKFASELRKQVK
jgi:ABC-type glycerol-3-phosphate transport system substrate-binding protein